MSCALAGKHRHQFPPCPPLGVGSKTGLVLRRPFAFCCKVAARVWFVHAGAASLPPTPPALCGRGCATTAYVSSVVLSLRGVMGGGFPLTPPNPLAGK
jgi:hypothetical protein